jgi:dihydroxyacetone kinase-like protein
MSTPQLLHCAKVAANALIANEAAIEGLDRAIGDGDHFHNMKRGAETVVRLSEELADVPADAALKAIGMKLMSTIGGASGPLTASFFLAAAKTDGVSGNWSLPVVARLVDDGVEAIRKRGGASRGDKTMLDVLIGVADTLKDCAQRGIPASEVLRAVRVAAEEGMESTRNLRATRGRAAFLGERAVGHIDPGAASCCVMTVAICSSLEGGGWVSDG